MSSGASLRRREGHAGHALRETAGRSHQTRKGLSRSCSLGPGAPASISAQKHPPESLEAQFSRDSPVSASSPNWDPPVALCVSLPPRPRLPSPSCDSGGVRTLAQTPAQGSPCNRSFGSVLWDRRPAPAEDVPGSRPENSASLGGAGGGASRARELGAGGTGPLCGPGPPPRAPGNLPLRRQRGGAG